MLKFTIFDYYFFRNYNFHIYIFDLNETMLVYGLSGKKHGHPEEQKLKSVI